MGRRVRFNCAICQTGEQRASFEQPRLFGSEGRTGRAFRARRDCCTRTPFAFPALNSSPLLLGAWVVEEVVGRDQGEKLLLGQ